MSLFNQVDTYQRLDKRIASKIEDGDLEVVLSPIIKNNLKFGSREYQTEAFTAITFTKFETSKISSHKTLA